MTLDLQPRAAFMPAVAAVLNALTPEDLRLRFGTPGTGGIGWLLDALASDRAHRAYVAREGAVPVAVLDTVCDGAGEIEFGVVVRPSHRRRGIARSMIDEMLDHARRRGVTAQFVALCLPDNRAAIALLRGAGFRAEGRWSEYVRFATPRE